MLIAEVEGCSGNHAGRVALVSWGVGGESLRLFSTKRLLSKQGLAAAGCSPQWPWGHVRAPEQLPEQHLALWALITD